MILGIQSINFALMQGFLPHFAADQYVGFNLSSRHARLTSQIVESG